MVQHRPVVLTYPAVLALCAPDTRLNLSDALPAYCAGARSLRLERYSDTGRRLPLTHRCPVVKHHDRTLMELDLVATSLVPFGGLHGEMLPAVVAGPVMGTCSPPAQSVLGLELPSHGAILLCSSYQPTASYQALEGLYDAVERVSNAFLTRSLALPVVATNSPTPR